MKWAVLTGILGALAAAILVLALVRGSEEARISAACEKFGAALGQEDFDGAAEAVNEVSRLSGHTVSVVSAFRELYPIGSTQAYPLKTLDLSPSYVRRVVFYARLAESIREKGSSDSDTIVRAFNQAVRGIWPPHSMRQLSGRNPRQLALAGVGSPVEIGWFFCTVCQTMDLPALIFNFWLKDAEESWPLAAVMSGKEWYLFAPGEGLPLVKKGTSHVASVQNLLDGESRIPGGEVVDIETFRAVTLIFASEAESFLPAASILQELLRDEGIAVRCCWSVFDYSGCIASIRGSVKSEVEFEQNVSTIWPYPFHIEEAAMIFREARGHVGSRLVENDTYVRAREFELTGRHIEALAAAGDGQGAAFTLLRARAHLGAGEFEKAVGDMEGVSLAGPAADEAAFIKGCALEALGRTHEAAESYRQVSGPRAALGSYHASVVTGARAAFTIPSQQ